MLWNHVNVFVDHKSVIYAFVKSSLLQEQFEMLYSIKVTSLFQNAGVEMNLLYSVLKLDKIIHIILCIQLYFCFLGTDGRNKTQCYGYLLLLITSSSFAFVRFWNDNLLLLRRQSKGLFRGFHKHLRWKALKVVNYF